MPGYPRAPILMLIGVLAAGCGGGGGNAPPSSSEPLPPPSYRLSGTITVASGIAMDGDVNDAAAPYAPNDDIERAQPLPNPVSVAGYVNVAGAGPSGRSSVPGDPSDYYQVALTTGQSVTLYHLAPAVLSLNVYDGTRELIHQAVDLASAAIFTAETAGTHYIEVRAESGASNYALTIGQGLLVADAAGDEDFVPGEVIVRFKDEEEVGAAHASLTSRARALGLQPLGGAPGRAMRLRMGSGAQRTRAFAKLGMTREVARGAAIGAALGVKARERWETLRLIGALRQRPEVLYAEPNYYRRSLLVPDDPLYRRQWHYPLIRLPAAWDLSTGDAVVVAVIDTGVLRDHPDLAGQFSGDGYDFVDGDADWNDPGDPLQPSKSLFHGTHVAGTVAAATGNEKGVAGVAWATTIMPVRVLDGAGVGTSYDVIQGIRYAAGLSNDSGTVPTRPADILNLSLGGGSYSSAEQALFNELHARSVFVVAAAGNASSSALSYPAAYDHVFSVSAVDLQRELAWYSNYGSTIDLAAPGGDTTVDLNGDGFPDGVLSTAATCVASCSGGSIDFQYRYYQGTSLAVPHVAGVMALMKAAKPDLTPAQFASLLAGGLLTDDLGAAGKDEQYGWGLIDAYRAVVAVHEDAPELPPALGVSPQSLSFGSIATNASLVLFNSGGGTVEEVTAASSAAWLNVSAVNIDTHGLGSYAASVDRSTLSDGVYSGVVTFTSGSDGVADLQVPVIMEVAAVQPTTHAGRHYILLVDAETDEVVDEAAVDVTEGSYTFSFDAPAGHSYYIYSGTDMNNDDFICDSGELCGAYPLISAPQPLTPVADRTDLDFHVGITSTVQDLRATTDALGAVQRAGKARGR
jgi:serine protease